MSRFPYKRLRTDRPSRVDYCFLWCCVKMRQDASTAEWVRGNSPCLRGLRAVPSDDSGYSDYKGYDDEVQAVQDQARALEKIAEDIAELKSAMEHPPNGQAG